ncbi:Trehalase [Bienertia sinuspersici]
MIMVMMMNQQQLLLFVKAMKNAMRFADSETTLQLVSSFLSDKETASKLSDPTDKKKLYCEVTSAAEPGWDFSTRWMSIGTADMDLTKFMTAYASVVLLLVDSAEF